MRLLLVRPVSPNERFGLGPFFRVEPLGLEYLGRALLEQGHDVRIADLRFGPSLRRLLRSFRPRVVGIACTHTVDVPAALGVAREVRRWAPGVFTLVGGHAASSFPDPLVLPEVDAIAIGDGELSVPELCGALARGSLPTALPGLWLRGASGWDAATPPVAQDRVNLDQVPLPARELIATQQSHYLCVHKMPLWAVETSRGCPYRCAFCSIWKHHGRTLRLRGIGHVAEDFARVGHNVFVVDDLFFAPSARSLELARELVRRGIKKDWMLVQARLDTVMKHAALLAEWRPVARQFDLFFGFESPTDQGLRSLDKQMTVSALEEGVRVAKSYGFGVTGNFVVDPDWGEADFHALWDLVDRLGLERSGYTVLTPLPGTPFSTRCARASTNATGRATTCTTSSGSRASAADASSSSSPKPGARTSSTPPTRGRSGSGGSGVSPSRRLGSLPASSTARGGCSTSTRISPRPFRCRCRRRWAMLRPWARGTRRPARWSGRPRQAGRPRQESPTASPAKPFDLRGEERLGSAVPPLVGGLVTAENIRSFTLLGASGSGKTSLAEALLYRAGVLHQLGRSENGGSFLDSEPEEANRAATVLAKVQSLAWGKYRVYLADTPGFADFIGQAIAPLAVLDAAVIVIDGTGGVDVATKQLFDLAKAHGRPILFFVNKLDRERADFRATVASLRKNLSPKAYPVTLPLGHGAEFYGVLDVLNAKAYGFDEGKVQEIPVPADGQSEREEAFQQLSEEVAASNDELLEKVLNGEQLTQEELSRQLVQAVKEGAILPVLCGTAFPPRGTTLLLDAITSLVPPTTELTPPLVKESETAEPVPLKLGEDEPAVAQVFRVSSDPGVGDLFFLKLSQRYHSPRRRPDQRTDQGEGTARAPVPHPGSRPQGAHRSGGGRRGGRGQAEEQLARPHARRGQGGGSPPIRFPDPVHAVSIIPKSRKDQDKMGPAVGKLVATDPTLEYRIDPEFNETILSGMGEVHLDFVAGRLKDRYGVELEWGPPHIPYRQTLTKKVEAQGRHKKQTGGHGQFGDCQIRVEPLPWGSGFEFEDEIKGGVIPGKWVPSVESGVRQAMKKGILGGYPVVDVRVALFYGSYHSVDSSDMAFQIAGSFAFKKAEEQAGPILLEPIMRIDVIAPADYVGAINGDLTSRRGRVIGMDQQGDLHVVRAEVPQAELFRYSTDLRSLTQGAGSFRMQYSRYEQVPGHLVDEVVKKAKAEAEKAKAAERGQPVRGAGRAGEAQERPNENARRGGSARERPACMLTIFVRGSGPGAARGGPDAR